MNIKCSKRCANPVRPGSSSLEPTWYQRSTATPGPAVLEQIGYLPEERGLPLRPRLLEMLAYFGELKGRTRHDARAQARELLRRVGLTERERSRVGELSKGNQQKVQIAAALMGEPRVLLVD